MPKEIRNVGASVRARLRNIARETDQNFELVLVRYALERLLYRLGISTYADRFVLKGAMLMTNWFADMYRVTRDLDLLGFGDSSSDTMVATFKEILAADVDDGVEFDVQGLYVDRVRELLDYGGLRLRTTALIDGARIIVPIDIGFGDALEPSAEIIEYPSMLDFPKPRIRAYARETVIAEKLEAMVILGYRNSRMKDFYDIWLLSESFPFDDDRLAQAIVATFQRRRTDIPTELPHALTPAFTETELKQSQWDAFLEHAVLNPGSLTNVAAKVAEFIMPHARAAAALLDERRSMRP